MHMPQTTVQLSSLQTVFAKYGQRAGCRLFIFRRGNSCDWSIALVMQKADHAR